MLPLERHHIDGVLSVALILVLGVWFGLGMRDTLTPLLIGAAFLGSLPVLQSVWASVRAREWASMDLLASVALIFSCIGGEWSSAVFIALMLAAARILADLTRSQTEKSIRALFSLRPETATVEREGGLVTVTPQDVVVGDIVHVELGERVPVDGVILRGSASIDQSSLTGESLPVDVTVESNVFSGTVVSSGSFVMRATKVGKDTTIERVIALVESSRNLKPTVQTLGERFGKIYLVTIFVASALLYAVTQNIPLVLSVVLVVCADDVAIAVPIAYLRAIRAAAKRGVIVKSARHLELLGSITTVVFDKTGTLTTGELQVASLITETGVDRAELLSSGARVAAHSSHPLSRALVSHAGVVEKVGDAREYAGKGIVVTHDGHALALGKPALFQELGMTIPESLVQRAREEAALGRSVSYIADGARVLGAVSAEDTIKHNAREVLHTLRSLGITKLCMLTGDNDRVAERVKKELGIDVVYANLLPEDKVRIVTELQKQSPVVMVGDGVNDAAALSCAGIGVAMGALGAEGAIESAEIVLMRDDLATLPLTIGLARKTRAISKQDFVLWGVTNAIGLGLVFGGVLGPPGAAAYNFLSDFLPLGNSLRVRL